MIAYKDKLPLTSYGENYADSIIEELTSKGYSIDYIDESGMSALHVAAARNHTIDVEKLLGHKVDINLISKGGWTPLYMATRYSAIEVMRMLLLAGANVNSPDGMHSPLHSAAEQGNIDMIALLSIFRVNPNPRTRINGYTPLHLAHFGRMNAVRALIEIGADATIKNNDGKTAGDIALEQGYTIAAKCLGTTAP